PLAPRPATDVTAAPGHTAGLPTTTGNTPACHRRRANILLAGRPQLGGGQPVQPAAAERSGMTWARRGRALTPGSAFPPARPCGPTHPRGPGLLDIRPALRGRGSCC